MASDTTIAALLGPDSQIGQRQRAEGRHAFTTFTRPGVSGLTIASAGRKGDSITWTGMLRSESKATKALAAEDLSALINSIDAAREAGTVYNLMEGDSTRTADLYIGSDTLTADRPAHTDMFILDFQERGGRDFAGNTSAWRVIVEFDLIFIKAL